MDDLDDFEDFYDHQHDAEVVRRHQRNFFEELSHSEFIEHFRFDKTSVRRLVGLLDGYLGARPFNGLNNEQQVSTY